MSDALIAHNEDLRRLAEEGFTLEVRGGYLIVHNVPFVTTKKTLDRGMLVSSLVLDAAGNTCRPVQDHTMHFAGNLPCHRNGEPLNSIIHGSGRNPLLPDLIVDHYFSSKPEADRKYEDYYEKVTTYEHHLGGAARSIDPTANGRSGGKSSAVSIESPFAIPDTAFARYRIADITSKLELNRVAIVGLGGTGSHVLDLLAKTPIRRIELHDGGQSLNHTLFRAPGAPVPDFLDGFPTKVEYYSKVYSRMHRGVVPHPKHITNDNIDQLAGFQFAFVCVDKGFVRRFIAEGLQRLGVPFIDTGIGMDREGNFLDGVARVTLIEPHFPWQQVESLLPFGDDDEDQNDIYKAAIQAGDLNALNANLAVMRFKRWCGFYRDSRCETTSSYMVEGNLIANRELRA
jgi:hypothetical protein